MMDRRRLPAVEIEYAWLTSAARSGAFFGPGDGLPTAFLLRHGICTWQGWPGVFRGVTLVDQINYVQDGRCRYYLAGVEAGGRHIDLSNAFFMVDVILHNQVVLGGSLFDRLQQECSIDAEHSFALDHRHVFAHAWPYVLPPVDEDFILYRQVHDALGLDEPTDSSQWMKRLCSCWAAPIAIPQMSVVIAPMLLRHTGVTRKWRGNRIVISMSRDSRVRTAQGETAATPEFFRSRPIVEYDGFLVPPSVAGLFATGRECGWPAIDCITNVVLEWYEDEARGVGRNAENGINVARWRFHPKCQVLATPEIVGGAPILGIMFNDACEDEKFDGAHPGLYCGFAFFHRLEEPPSSLDFVDFDRLKHIDAHVEEVIEKAIPGLYTRESELAPFTWKELDLSEDDDAAEDRAGEDEEGQSDLPAVQ